MNIRFPYKMLQAYNACCRGLCQELKIPQTAFDILLFLGNNPALNTARDIVEVRKIKANLVSVNVDRLVQEGYLERRSVPGDRRKAYLVCTEKAKPVIRRGQEIQAAFFRRLFDGVDEELQEKFRRVIRAVEENLDTMIEEAQG